jgi:phage terminase large subunit-like protein
MFEAASVYFPNLNFYKKWEEEKIQEMLSKNDKN